MSLPNPEDTLKPGVEPREDEIEVIMPEEEVELEVVDDTPKEDRNRKPLNEDPEPSEEELEEYSEAVKKRIGKMKHGLHDERRAKEAAARERDEAIALSKQLFAEKKALEARMIQGEEALISHTKDKAGMTMAEAKRAYKAAYEIGDADAMADAQEKMALVALEQKQAEEWSKQAAQRKEIARQESERMVQSPQIAKETVPEPDPEVVEWAEKNTWFGKNMRMTNLAYAIHDELVADGIDPKRDADEYYTKLNAEMRTTFPDYEWGDKPKKRTASVVAPVNRTTNKATKVTLTQSQLSVARKMGLTPQQYAIEVAKLEK